MSVNMLRIAELIAADTNRYFHAPESMEQRRDRIHHVRIGELLGEVQDPAVQEILELLAVGVRARTI